MSAPSIPPPLAPAELATTLTALRDSAQDLAERLTAFWIDLESDALGVALDPMVTNAQVHAALVDAVHQRMTRQPMTTDIGVRLDAHRGGQAPGLRP